MITTNIFPFSSSGLGIAYSSLSQFGEIIPAAALGQAGIKVYTNIATGNVVIQDRMVSSSERNGLLNLGYYYNSLVQGTAWRMAIKSLANLPRPPQVASATIAVIENDAHVTLYNLQDKETYTYTSPVGNNSTAIISYDKSKQLWLWYDPATSRKEEYDVLGRLCRSYDGRGRCSIYSYDNTNQLIGVEAPGGNKYQIVREGNVVCIYLLDPEIYKEKVLMQQHIFDKLGRLVTTAVAKYVINYSYYDNSNFILSVSQSDQNTMKFFYNSQQQLEQVYIGSDKKEVFNFDYKNTATTIRDICSGNYGGIEFGIDSKKRITSVTTHSGTVEPYTPATTTYCYDQASEQLSRIIRPNGSVKEYRFSTLGLLFEVKDSAVEGQGTIYTHDDHTGALLVETHNSSNAKKLPELLSTYYVYAGLENNQKFLRFIVSSTGKVTEYRYNNDGDVASKRIYIAAKFDLSQIKFRPSLADLEQWVMQQDAQQVMLIEFFYNARGQIDRQVEYANVNSQGKGIYDDQTRLTNTKWTYFDQWLLREQRQGVKTQASLTMQKDYDSLQRLCLQIDAPTYDVQAKTTFQQDDANGKLTITRPNGRIETVNIDSKGLISSESQMVTINSVAETRTTAYERDTRGRPIVIHQADGETSYKFYDIQNRPLYEVNAAGTVIGYTYDASNLYVAKTLYIHAIDLTKIRPYPKILPSLYDLEQLLNQVKNPSHDRVNYNFFDKKGKLRFEVAANNFVTETRYDMVDRPIASLKYKTAISAEQLTTLKNGQMLNLIPMVSDDQWIQYFYTKDSEKIGEQDAAGYVTEYIRNGAGQIIEKIQYSQPTEHLSGMDEVRPPVNLNADIHTYYFYNGLSQKIAEIDGEGYLTKREYTATAKIAKETRFKNLVKADPALVKSLAQLMPDPSADDYVTTYKYDALDREVERSLPEGAVIKQQYDSNGNIILRSKNDLLTDVAVRQTQYREHGWNQPEIFAECDPRQAKVLMDIDADNTLPPDEKTRRREEVWANKSLRYVYGAGGLKVKAIDPNGSVTCYYYDDAQRLRFSVNPRGAVSEIKYNALAEDIETRKYCNFIAPEILPTLTGGFINAAVQSLFAHLADDAKDAITTKVRDLAGNVVEIIDAEGNVSQKEYDAFGQCVLEKLPVQGKRPSMEIAHCYDIRGGLETVTEVSANGKVFSTISATYANLLGKKTSYRNAVGGKFNFTHDKLGRVVCVVNPLQAETKSEFDAFNYLVKRTNAAGDVVVHEIDRVERTHTTKKCDAAGKVLYQQTEVYNGFKEVVSIEDALGCVSTKEYGVDGQVEKSQDALQQEITAEFDLCGLKRSQRNQAEIETIFQYDEAGNQIQQIFDPSGLALKTDSTFDAFNHEVKSVDPRKVETQRKFDKKDNLRNTTVDPNGLAISTAITYNAQNLRDTVQKAYAAAPEQKFTLMNQHDEVGRDVGVVVDPDGMKINTSQRLNAAGNVIAAIDGNGNVTRNFYDQLLQKRFEVDAMGGVTEYIYNLLGQETSARNYAVAINSDNLHDETQLEEIAVLMQDKKSSADKVSYKFYDHAGCLRFTVSGLGAVIEKGYNANLVEVSTRLYATQIDITNLENSTTEEVAARVKASAKDRTIYKILDALGRDRFIIDARGYVTEQRFDAVGNIITTIKYANAVTDPAALAKLSAEEVVRYLSLDLANDRVTYQIFDSRNQPRFSVDPEGAVIAYANDENGNMVRSCAFAKQINVPASYADLIQLLESLPEDTTADRITIYEYDAANREVNITSPLGLNDSYVRDVIGNVIEHVDKANVSWLSEYDRAKRLVQEITPPISATLVTEYDNSGHLTCSAKTMPIIKKIELDNAHNQTRMIMGYSSGEDRAVSFQYNRCNKVSGVTVSVIVDDASKNASFQDKPVKQAENITYTIYDAKSNPVVDIDALGNAKFTVYNSENLLIYTINALGAVVECVYNAFGEVEKQLSYATALTDIDFKKYLDNGLTMDVVKAHLVVNPDEDRAQYFEYDKSGNKISIKSDPIFYYIANGADEAKFGFAEQKTAIKVNGFGEEVAIAKLLDPELEIYSENFYWRNRNGCTLAKADPNRYVARYQRNAFGEPIASTEFARPLATNPASLSLSELDKILVTDIADRSYIFEYDKIGQKITDITTGITASRLVFSGNIPNVQDFTQDVVRRYQYAPTSTAQKPLCTAVTDENGLSAYTYFNYRGDRIAETDVPRHSVDDAGNSIILIPLVEYGVNSFGQQVRKTKYLSGTACADLSSVPLPIRIDGNNDQTTLKLYDARGLDYLTQNSQGNVIGATHLPTGQLARTWQNFTNWQQNGSNYSTVTHVDEKRFSFDAALNPLKEIILRDGNLVVVTESKYNVFGEEISEGPGDGTFPVYKKFDKCGKVWSSNCEQGVARIYLGDLSGQRTLLAESATDDLSALLYNDLYGVFLGWGQDESRLERTETQKDLGGRVVAKKMPDYKQQSLVSPDNLPINIATGRLYAFTEPSTLADAAITLSWANIVETNVVVADQIVLRQHSDNSAQAYLLPIVTTDDRCYVNLAQLPSGRYEYEISYYLVDPTTKQKEANPRYSSIGTVQCNTGINEGSNALVTQVEPDQKTLLLTGKTAGLTAIELWTGSEKVTTIPVVLDTNTQTALVDLSWYMSGTYTIKPIGTENTDVSYPFTIHTTVVSDKPLAREISCKVDFKVLDSWGQINWQVSDFLAGQAIKLICSYRNEGNHDRIFEGIISPNTDKGHYIDQQGDELICNIEFGEKVSSVQHLLICIQVDGTWIQILDNAITLPKPDDKSQQKNFDLQLVPAGTSRLIRTSQRGKGKEKEKNRAKDKVNSLLSFAKVSATGLATGVVSAAVAAEYLNDDVDALSRVGKMGIAFAAGCIGGAVTAYDRLGIGSPSSIQSNLKSLTVSGDEPIPVDSDIVTYDQATNYTMYFTTFGELPASTDSINVFNTGLDRQSAWIPLAITSLETLDITTGKFTIDVTGLHMGKYPYNIGDIDGNFELTHGQQVFSSSPLPPAALNLVRPVHYYQSDAWGNVTRDTDSLGNVVTNNYNWRNQLLTKTLPPLTVVDEHGVTHTDVILTEGYAYNLMGMKIGERNRTGNVTGYEVDEAGQVLSKILPDGTREKMSVYDAFERETRFCDARWKYTRHNYDRGDNLTCITFPSGSRTAYLYNESKRMSESDNWGHTTRYNYDAMQHMETSFKPMRQTTQMRSDRNGQLLYQQNADGSLFWDRNFFGRELRHVDLSGAIYNSNYDHKWQLCSRSSYGGYHDTYLPFNPYASWFSSTPVVTPGQNIVNTYLAGQLIRVDDGAKGQTTLKDFDAEGRPVSLEIINSDGTILQKINSRLDAVGRVYWTYDTSAEVMVGFDANGNRRYVALNAYCFNQCVSRWQWSAYDAADRVIVDSGVWQNGNITIAPGQGTILIYANNFRVQEVYLDPSKGQVTNVLQYDDDGRLASTAASGIDSAIWRYRKTSGRGVDGVGRPNAYNDYEYVDYYIRLPYWWGWMRENLHSSSSTTSYNDNSEVTAIVQSQDGHSSSTYFTGHTADGESLHQDSYYSGDGGVSDHLDSGYARYDNLQLASIGGYRHDDYGTSGYSSVHKYHGPNGEVQAVQGADTSTNNGYMKTNGENQVVVKWDNPITLMQHIGWFFDSGEVEFIHRISKYLYDVNGDVLGSYALVDTLSEIFRRFFFRNINRQDIKRQVIEDLNVYLDYTQRVTSSFPAQGPSEMVVIEGDSFSLISLKATGSSSFAGAIAEYNGWSVDSAPSAGLRIRIPAFLANTNDFASTIPYGIIESLIIGSLYPHLDTPQPPKHHHSWWSSIIEIVVSVVVAVVAPELVASFFTVIAAVSETAASVMTWAAAGILASTAGQLTGIAFGDQQGFSLANLGLAAVSGGIAGYFAPAAGVALGIMETIMNTAKILVLQQLTELTLGMRKNFDMRAIIAEVAAAAANAKIGLNVGENDKLVAVTGKELAKSAVRLASDIAITGARLNLESFVATTIGSIVQDEASILKVRMQESAVKKTRADAEAAASKADSAANAQNAKAGNSKQSGFFGDSREYKEKVLSASKTEAKSTAKSAQGQIQKNNSGLSEHTLLSGASTSSSSDNAIETAVADAFSPEAIFGKGHAAEFAETGFSNLTAEQIFDEHLHDIANASFSSKKYDFQSQVTHAFWHNPSMINEIANDMYSTSSELFLAKRLSADELRSRGLNPAEFNDGATGFHAAVYRLPDDSLVCAFRGTKILHILTDDVTDWHEVKGQYVKAYSEAAKLAKSIGYAFPRADLSFTGHSLGGGEATVAALAVGKEATVFNSLGVNQFMRNKLELPVNLADSEVTNYYVHGEFIKSVGEKIFSAERPLGNQVEMKGVFKPFVEVHPDLSRFFPVFAHAYNFRDELNLHREDGVISALNIYK